MTILSISVDEIILTRESGFNTCKGYGPRDCVSQELRSVSALGRLASYSRLIPEDVSGSRQGKGLSLLSPYTEGLAIEPYDKAAHLLSAQVNLPRAEEEAEGMETDNVAADVASAVAALDFDSLSRQQKARMEKAAREQLDSQFAADIEEQQAALTKVLPNLKAVEQYEEAKVCYVH